MTPENDNAAPAHLPGPPIETYRIPKPSWWGLFLRFLRFGALAWGGPVAQIAMIRQELVDEERWISSAHFNRVLALYQVLPGPEAHELCVYFGMRARGRWGGVVAGLGFMLPGFVLMFLLSWAYLRYGLQMQQTATVFAAVQVAVAALIVRAVVRIGGHVMTDRWLWAIALWATAAQLAGLPFGAILVIGGLLYLLARGRYPRIASAMAALAFAAVAGYVLAVGGLPGFEALIGSAAAADSSPRGTISTAGLFWSGLKAGLLTFGGAYTAIPFLQRDAVTQGAWMSNAQFLDGVALSGLLPAPLIIFSTFVGYLGGGPLGALAMTAGVFLPAFAFTLTAHDALERLVQRPLMRIFLGGVTASVVGLIAGTTLALLKISLTGLLPLVLFALILTALFLSKSRLVIPLAIAGAAVWGMLSLMLGG